MANGAANAALNQDAESVLPSLSDVSGIGPGYRKRLEERGVTLHQLAAWTADDVDAWQAVLRARIREEQWVEQAQAIIAAMGEEDSAQPPKPAPRPSLTTSQDTPRASAPAYEADDDPLEDLSMDELRDLARQSLAARPQPSGGGLQKRGMVQRLRIVQQPSFIPFNRAKAVLKRLDRNKKFAYQIGDYFGAHFFQKGRYFDHEGIEIPFTENGVPLTPEEIAELYVEEDHVVTDASEVNLANWYEKKVEYELPLVLKAIHRFYRKRFETESAARNFLHQVLRSNL